MTIDLATLPHPDFLPIPADVKPSGPRWTPMMVEIADHIGAHTTLVLCDRFGGQRVNIPRDASKSPFRGVLDDHVVQTISCIFGGEQVDIPTARAALRHARRQGVLARVRVGELNLSEAARILRTSRRRMSELVNQSTEGVVPAGTVTTTDVGRSGT